MSSIILHGCNCGAHFNGHAGVTFCARSLKHYAASRYIDLDKVVPGKLHWFLNIISVLLGNVVLQVVIGYYNIIRLFRHNVPVKSETRLLVHAALGHCMFDLEFNQLKMRSRPYRMKIYTISNS